MLLSFCACTELTSSRQRKSRFSQRTNFSHSAPRARRALWDCLKKARFASLSPSPEFRALAGDSFYSLTNTFSNFNIKSLCTLHRTLVEASKNVWNCAFGSSIRRETGRAFLLFPEEKMTPTDGLCGCAEYGGKGSFRLCDVSTLLRTGKCFGKWLRLPGARAACFARLPWRFVSNNTVVFNQVYRKIDA